MDVEPLNETSSEPVADVHAKRRHEWHEEMDLITSGQHGYWKRDPYWPRKDDGLSEPVVDVPSAIDQSVNFQIDYVAEYTRTAVVILAAVFLAVVLFLALTLPPVR